MPEFDDKPTYDLAQYPLAYGDFVPAHRGEDGQYYLLPGLPILPDAPGTPLPEAWKRAPGEGECGLPDAAVQEDEAESVGEMLRLSRYEQIVYAVVACLVLLIVFRNLPGVRDWGCWR